MCVFFYVKGQFLTKTSVADVVSTQEIGNRHAFFACQLKGLNSQDSVCADDIEVVFAVGRQASPFQWSLHPLRAHRCKWGLATLCGVGATFSGSSKDPSRPR